ncbi:MAG: hypothetical protein ABIJ97_12835 [Bacteroidota bacterium]
MTTTPITKLIAGLDEIATETQKSEGWCYFCIPETEYLKFETEVKALLSGTTKLTSFHGKKFKADQANEYEQFFRIIRRYAENSVPTILSCTLNSENWKQKFLKFCDRITTNVFTQVGVTNQDLITVCKQLTPGLFSFMRLINHFGNTNELVMEVDSDSLKENYPNLDTIIKGNKFTADFLMTLLYNAYRKFQFANSPKLSANGISVLKDQYSFAIQAADVIGNFSTSYVYYKLGNTSKTRILKGQIFEKVFGDKYGLENFSSSVRLVGQNDLELLIEGGFTMEFTAYHE